MKVVHVVRSDAFAGVERSVVMSSRALAALGHEVVVIGGSRAAMLPALGPAGVRWLPAASTAEVVRALVRVGRADVVHAHMTAAEVAAVVTRWRHRGRLVVTRHFARRRGTSRSGRLAAAMVHRAPRVEASISEYVAAHVDGPSVVVPHGVDDQEAVAATGRTIVVVQRLEPEKETDIALTAFARSGLAASGWTLEIAGDGSQRAALEALADRLGVAGAVRFLGRVADVAAVRARAALQIAPTSIEGFGFSVVEAMACGLPVVAADGGAHRELFAGVDGALLFPPGDADAAAALLRAAAGDEAGRRALGARLQQRQRAAYSLAAHGRALEAAYVTPVPRPRDGSVGGRSALRVVHVVRSDYFAGVERSIVLSARALVGRGHQVTVIGGEPSTMQRLLAGVDVRWLPAATTPEVMLALRRVGRVDITHAHMTAAEAAALLTWPWHRGHLVATRHFAARRGSTVPGRIAAGALALVPHDEIAISRFVAGRIGRDSTLVAHGLPEEEPVAGVEPVVLLVQRLDAEKDTGTAIEAWARSGLAAEGWTMVIAGDGAQRTALEQRAARLGVADSVRFLGRVGDVRSLRQRAGFQLATPPAEPFGLSVAEAMACGLAVLAADGGTHRELLGADARVYFPAGDADACAERMRAFAHDPAMRAAIAVEQRRRQQAFFSLDAHGEALERLYRRVRSR
jgi:glycosyltransferase involved in cell wall biosynthesis